MNKRKVTPIMGLEIKRNITKTKKRNVEGEIEFMEKTNKSYVHARDENF